MKFKKLVSIFMLFLLLLILPITVLAEENQDFVEDVKAKLTGLIGKYQVENFVVTHYSPLDSALKSDADSTKRLGKGSGGSNDISPVQWYKDGGKWVFSAATEKRRDLVLDKYKTKLHNSSTYSKRTYNVGGHAEKTVYEIVFVSGIDFTESERLAVLPLGCAGRGMNYAGDPWLGSSGKIAKTGMIAADKTVLPQGTKLFVQGYGFGEVLDVGGAIKGKRLDLTVNDCDVALAKGKKGALVAFDPGSAKIKGVALDENAIKGLLAGGVYGTTYIDKETNDDTSSYVPIKFESQFGKGDVEVDNVGVDDKEVNNLTNSSFVGNKYIGIVSAILFKIAQVASIFLIGFIIIIWLLAVLSYSGMSFANDILYRYSKGRIDVMESGGLIKLGIWTGFSFLVLIFILTGLIPKIFSLIYHLLSIFIDFILGFKLFF